MEAQFELADVKVFLLFENMTWTMYTMYIVVDVGQYTVSNLQLIDLF